MIKLLPFESNDIQLLITWIDNPKFLMQWAGPNYNWPLTAEQIQNDIDKSKIIPLSLLLYKAIDNDNQNVIGHIQLMNINYESKSAMIGRVLIGDKNYKGKGHGKDLMNEIIKIAFDDLKLDLLNLAVFDFNLPAIKSYEKVGFIYEKTFKNCRKIENEVWSLIFMKLYKKQYENKNKSG